MKGAAQNIRLSRCNLLLILIFFFYRAHLNSSMHYVRDFTVYTYHKREASNKKTGTAHIEWPGNLSRDRGYLVIGLKLAGQAK